MSWQPPETDEWVPPETDEVVGQPQTQLQPEQSLGNRVWNALGVPEQMSRQGLQSLASMVPEPEPTGNLPLDLAKGTPRILANTMAQAAPGFISRGSLLTGAAAKALPAVGKVVAPVGKWAAGIAEDWAGIKPGSLEAAAKDASLIFAKGKQSAGKLYQEAQAELPYEQTLFRGITSPKGIVDKAVETIEKGGQLEPQEGLIARKALDKIRKSLSEDAFTYYRSALDKIAKANENIAAADPQYVRALQGQSLRGLFPRNVGGRASPFKVAEGGWLAKTLGVPGAVAGLAMSPLALGTAATVGGVAARVASNPQAAMASQQLISTVIDRFVH